MLSKPALTTSARSLYSSPLLICLIQIDRKRFPARIQIDNTFYCNELGEARVHDMALEQIILTRVKIMQLFIQEFH
jgi:hypothetical protein